MGGTRSPARRAHMCGGGRCCTPRTPPMGMIPARAAEGGAAGATPASRLHHPAKGRWGSGAAPGRHRHVCAACLPNHPAARPGRSGAGGVPGDPQDRRDRRQGDVGGRGERDDSPPRRRGRVHPGADRVVGRAFAAVRVRHRSVPARRGRARDHAADRAPRPRRCSRSTPANTHPSWGMPLPGLAFSHARPRNGCARRYCRSVPSRRTRRTGRCSSTGATPPTRTRCPPTRPP